MEALKDHNLIYLSNKIYDCIERFGEEGKYRYIDFYEEISPVQLKDFFSLFHYHINRLFKYMNSRLNTNHYSAAESRDLIYAIQEVDKVETELKYTNYAFELNEYYKEIMQQCEAFLQESGGSIIPFGFEKINIIEREPVFKVKSSISMKRNKNKVSFQLKGVGTGSYATVHKYKDDFYNRTFAVKKADKDLTTEEYERFKIEFEEMKKLNSPYVIEVYNFDEENRQYIMEYADETLDDYILKTNNNSLETSERINLVRQVLRAFIYINSKNVLHRDISTKNILVKKYEGINVIKVSDFGLVKREDSSLTNVNTKMKGYFNDRKLEIIGFSNYKIWHETYALTRIIYFIMTGKTTLAPFENDDFKRFIETGIADDETKRYQSVEEMQKAFNNIAHTFR